MPDTSYLCKINYRLYDTGVMNTFDEAYERDKHAIGAGVCQVYPGQPGFSKTSSINSLPMFQYSMVRDQRVMGFSKFISILKIFGSLSTKIKCQH